MHINTKKIDNFWKRRAKIKDPRISTHFKQDDTHVFDLKLIRKFCKPTSHMLDLACGTCYLSNELINEVAYIKAVDKYGEFLTHCKTVPNLETVTKDILDFDDTKKYDIILLFGIVMYFNEIDTRAIYRKCKKLLKKGGIVIVKHQCGVLKDVVVDSYSPVIKDTYHAVYKHVEKDKKLLEEFFDFEVINIYPPRLNPWPNTHFYAFIAQHKN